MRKPPTRLAEAARPGKAPRSVTLRSRARFALAGRGWGSGWGGISCVPYARMVTGMEISGNGNMWWHNAAGSYARGQRPEPGSVMAFPGSGGMRLGHVAVVNRVLGPRELLIDHANWGGPGIRPGSVMHAVSVQDVSDANDWTAVRVQVGYDNTTFGRTYPTYGFIYNRPDASSGPTAYAAAMPARETPLRRSVSFQQVAEMGPLSLSRAAAASRAAAPSRAEAASRAAATSRAAAASWSQPATPARRVVFASAGRQVQVAPAGRQVQGAPGGRLGHAAPTGRAGARGR